MPPNPPSDDADETIVEARRREPGGRDGLEPEPGDRIGPFVLRGVLGSGGMGKVYLAEQLEPVRREVALKLLQGNLLDPTRVARFTVEQQALARMSHPAIAQVYDAGTTPEGRPYFAMEHVPGEPITEFCSLHDLDLRQRLELFAKVCRGVQHAHQKGIIHRDLKPSNILVRLVDQQPSPKIIDFGIATAAHAASGQQPSIRTSVSGTPTYMSPEQADLSEADIDTRTDIYSLGAVLYELLTGATPVNPGRLRDKPLAELHRILGESEIEAPSELLKRQTSPLIERESSPHARRRLLKRLRSEIDSIVLKALAGDRNLRYPTAADLAHDVEAFLAGRPVEAVPATVGYRLGKLAGRHKAVLAGSAAVAVALVVGLALATWGLLQARQQRDRALDAEALSKVETAKAEQVAGFIQSILSGVDPAVAGALDKTLVRRILEDASERIGSELGEQPEVAATIHYTIAATYASLGEYERAFEHFTSSRELLEGELGPGDPAIQASVVGQALVRRRQGRYDEAEGLLLEAIATLRAELGDDDPQTLSTVAELASLYLWQGRFADSERLYLEALDGCRRIHGQGHRETLTVANNLGLLYSEQGRFAEAEPLYLEVLAKSRETLGSDHPDTINSLNNLAALDEQLGRFERAEELYLEAIERGERVLGGDHPETLNMMNNLAVLYRNIGRLEDAETLHRQVLAEGRRVLGPDHPDTLNSLNNLAFVVMELGRPGESDALLAEAAATARRVLSDDSLLTGRILSNHGWVLTDLGRWGEAETELVEARGIFERRLEPDHPLTRTVVERLEELERRRPR